MPKMGQFEFGFSKKRTPGESKSFRPRAFVDGRVATDPKPIKEEISQSGQNSQDKDSQDKEKKDKTKVFKPVSPEEREDDNPRYGH